MKINISKITRHALLIEENDLKSLCQFVLEHYKKINIYASCVDGTTLETENIEDIISFENPNYRRVKSFALQAQNDMGESLSIRIQPETIAFFPENAEIKIESQKDAHALYISNELAKKLGEMKPWYSLIAIIPFMFLLSLVGVFLLTIIVIFGIISGVASTPRFLDSLTVGSIFANANILGTCGWLIIIFFGTWIQEKLFPKVFFNLGKQKKTMEILKRWHGIIFGGVLLAIIVSVASNIISSWLINK